jgi:L-cysteine desulfidase
MKRRLALAVFGTLLCSGAVAANPSAAEAARIDKLIAAVAKRDDIKFIRNGSEYNCNQAADFLRGKLKWRIDKVVTVQDFIDQIGTRSTTTGDLYMVRMPSGEIMPSAQFLRLELERIEKR